MQSYSIQIEKGLADEAQAVLQGMGGDITSAVTAFLRRTVRNAKPDPDLYTEEEMEEIHRRGMEEIRAGKGIRVSMETLERMADE
ncbi:MAG: hypothetical protein IKN96_03330 [Oscillibacter sp.]|nr:hypothetical protein [Oscillibacter sp.]